MTVSRCVRVVLPVVLALTLGGFARAQEDDVLTRLRVLNTSYLTAYRAWLTERYRTSPDPALMDAHHRRFRADYARYQTLLRANPGLLVQIGLPMVAESVGPVEPGPPTPTALPLPTVTPRPTPSLPPPPGVSRPPIGIESVQR